MANSNGMAIPMEVVASTRAFLRGWAEVGQGIPLNPDAYAGSFEELAPGVRGNCQNLYETGRQCARHALTVFSRLPDLFYGDRIDRAALGVISSAITSGGLRLTNKRTLLRER